MIPDIKLSLMFPKVPLRDIIMEQKGGIQSLSHNPCQMCLNRTKDKGIEASIDKRAY